MASAAVNILGFILILLIIAFFIGVIMSISLVISTFDDFINYMNSAFLEMFGLIETETVELFDILYSDVVDLIDELTNDFTPYF